MSVWLDWWWLQLLAGPGTIGCALLSKGRWQRFRKLIPVAILWNLLGLFILMLVMAILLQRALRGAGP